MVRIGFLVIVWLLCFPVGFCSGGLIVEEQVSSLFLSMGFVSRFLLWGMFPCYLVVAKVYQYINK